MRIVATTPPPARGAITNEAVEPNIVWSRSRVFEIPTPRQRERISLATRGDCDNSFVDDLRDAVPQRVFDERLKHKAGYERSTNGCVDRPADAQPVRKPNLLDREILLEKANLLVERDFVARLRSEHRVQHIAEQFQHPRCGRCVLVAHQHTDGIQTVEQEVRIELHSQRTQS